MAEQHELGKRGEALAANYLKQSGYTLLDLNWRSGRDEVDIIAHHAHSLAGRLIATEPVGSAMCDQRPSNLERRA